MGEGQSAKGALSPLPNISGDAPLILLLGLLRCQGGHSAGREGSLARVRLPKALGQSPKEWKVENTMGSQGGGSVARAWASLV